jgi:glycosyltransferase involved in cell wall biosynthesis
MRTAPAMTNSNNPDFPVYFAVPGDINNLTGGYGYDRELIKGLSQLGIIVELLSLSAEFPIPSASTIEETALLFASLPDGAIVIADGLAFGVMDNIARQEATRLNIIALCHHPLALETGISVEQARQLQASEAIALAAARAVIVTSAATAQLLIQHFSVSAEKISLACPGTYRQQFATSNNQPPQLLTVATLTKRKGHDVLIKALAQIKHLDWQARWVGSAAFDPEWASDLVQLIYSSGLENRIEILGNIDDLNSEFSSADAFILPSHFEGYGMAFAEALAFGLPVIAAHAGAVPDLVPADAGILIPPANEHALAIAITELLTNHPYRQQLQLGAQRAALTLPTWKDCAKIVVGVINHLRNL